MQLVLFLCLLVVFHPTFGLTVPDSECCQTKSVGSVEYALANTGNTSTCGCLNDCIYTRLGEDPSSQKYCFKAGDLPVNCGDKDVVGGASSVGELCSHIGRLTFHKCTGCPVPSLDTCVKNAPCSCATIFNEANADCAAYGAACFGAIHSQYGKQSLKTWGKLFVIAAPLWFLGKACSDNPCLCQAWDKYFQMNPNMQPPNGKCPEA